MDQVLAIWDFLKSDAGTGALLGLWMISEALASIPAIKANSMFQVISGLLSKLQRKPA